MLVGVRVQYDQRERQDYLVLETDYEGFRQTGVLLVPDASLRSRVLEILKANIGRSIWEIGALEL